MEKQTAVRETLLKEFANCSDKLFTLGIIRTDSFTGEIGEFIASKYFKLSLAGKSTKAYDGVCPKGYKYQIKSKVISNNNFTHHISNLKYQDFDYLVVVYFDIYYNPISILKIHYWRFFCAFIFSEYSSIKITSKRTSRYQKFCSKLLEFTKRRDY